MNVLTVTAQSTHKNKLIADLCAQLSSAYGVADQWTGERYIRELSADRPVIIQRDKQHIFNHVGIKLFDREVMGEHLSPLFYFAERYMLELLLLKGEDDIRHKLMRERVALSSDIHSMSSYRKGIRKILASFSDDCSIFLTYRNNRGMLSCVNGRKTVFTLAFPLRHELITGDTKLEAENALHAQYLDYLLTRKPTHMEWDLTVYKDSLYKNNDDYYVTEPMVSTSYYYIQGNDTIPVLSPDYVAESVYNLFNARVTDSIQMEVTQKLYGGKKNTFTCPLPLFVEFIRSQGCSVYTSIRSVNSAEIKGSVVAVHLELGYQHLLRFSFSRELLQSPDKHVVKADMYSYIPIHNLSSMYSDK